MLETIQQNNIGKEYQTYKPLRTFTNKQTNKAKKKRKKQKTFGQLRILTLRQRLSKFEIGNTLNHPPTNHLQITRNSTTNNLEIKNNKNKNKYKHSIMTHNRENLRLSLHDLQQTTTAPINTSSSTSSVSQSMSVIANQAITTVANKLTKGSGGGGAAYQNDKCERLKKMTSITCSDSEDDSERRIQLDGGVGSNIASGVGNNAGVSIGVGCLKWNIGGYEGVS